MNSIEKPVSKTSALSSHSVPSFIKGEKDNADFDKSQVNQRLTCLLNPYSETAENYSRVRLALETLRGDEQSLVVGFTSAAKGEGKTVTAINVAGSLARSANARVLLIDLNFRSRSSRVIDFVNLKTLAGPGITEWHDDSSDPEGEPRISFIPGFNLHVVVSGKSTNAPYELLKSPKLARFVSTVRHRYDFVIVDAPEVLNLPDTDLIARLVDGFIMVVRADKTPKAKLGEAFNLMSQDKVLGLILNGATH